MMGIEIHEEIVENLKNLDSFQLTEVLDFVRFLNYRQKEHIADTSIIDNLFGTNFEFILFLFVIFS